MEAVWPTKHEKELSDLAEHASNVLDLFPWPDNSPSSEDGTGGRGVVVGLLRTPQQVAAEQNLRRLRGALNNLVGEIDGYLHPASPEG